MRALFMVAARRAGKVPDPRAAPKSVVPEWIDSCFDRRYQAMKATIREGLDGTGARPVHLHTGRPTPWSEGIVVRVEPDHSVPWTLNAQTGYGYATKIVPWPPARSFVLFARGACYLVSAEQPDSWVFLDELGIDCRLTPDEGLAVIATYTDVLAVRPDGQVVWRRRMALDGVELSQVADGIVEGRACLDPPDDWVPFRLRAATGTDA